VSSSSVPLELATPVATTERERLPSARSFAARTTLTRGDRLVLGAVAEAMFSQDGEVEHAALEAHLDQVDAFISAASKTLRLGLRLALFVVRISPLLLFFRMRTIERLPVDERVAVLSRLERSRVSNLSLAFIGWRAVMTLVFYESAAELKTLGYASDERKVYKRRLALVAPSLPLGLPLLPTTPLPEESGVRLRGGDAHDRDSEHPPVAAPIDAPRDVA
jgi:hypothetical protein